MKKYLIAGGFLLVGIYFLRKLTKGELTKKQNPNAQDLISEEQGILFQGKKCPISKENIEQNRKIKEMINKTNPFFRPTAPQYPFEWNELCTKNQISEFQDSLKDIGKRWIKK